MYHPVMDQPRTAAALADTHGLDDLVLLRRIAEARDEAAFEELFRRHTDHAYSLALNITGNAQRAEDVVQEAFAVVWTRAEQCRAGNPKAWILGIVARKGLHMNRRRGELPLEDLDGVQERSPGGSAEERLAKQELLGEIRALLQKLPRRERAMVALHFGGGMSQAEIAKELGMPPRTLSTRLASVLAELREGLAAAGFAAAVPLLNEQKLAEALTSGMRAPAGMAERVAGRVLREAGRQSARVAALGKASWLLYALALIGAGAAWYAVPRDGASIEKSVPQVEAKSTPAVPVAPEAPKPFYVKWDFTTKPAEFPPAFQGGWTWGKFEGKGCLVPSDDPPLVLTLLPVRLPPKNMLIKINVISQKGNMRFAPLWVNEQGMVVRRTWEPVQKELNGYHHVQRVFLLGEYIVSVLDRDESRTMVQQYKEPFPSDRFMLSFQLWRVRDIEIRELAADDPELKGIDPQALIQRILTLGGGRTGWVPPEPVNWPAIPQQYR